MKTMASVQDTSLDVVWIRDGVVALGYRAADRCYRAVLAAEGPPEAFAAEADRVAPLVAGFAGFLNALSQASVLPPSGLQVLVRSERTDLSEYAARLERRALGLPVDLAREALADAAWARNEGAGLGLLPRRAYLVIPAEALVGADLAARLANLGLGLRRWFKVKSRLSETEARQALDTRCAELAERLQHCGVSVSRLYDVGLTRLFQACWTVRRNGRFEDDLQKSVLSPVKCVKAGWVGIAVVVTPDWGHVGNPQGCPSSASAERHVPSGVITCSRSLAAAPPRPSRVSPATRR